MLRARPRVPQLANVRGLPAGNCDSASGVSMPARIKTTTVGSYPVPIWPTGSMSRQVLRDAVIAVLKTQEAVFDYNDSNNLFY